MRLPFMKLLSKLMLAVALVSSSLPTVSRAQIYAIDCAILLCLSGGWPVSEPCTQARAEFIRRITPWPVEPPLQIWRCPMGASYESDRKPNRSDHILEALFQTEGHRPRQSFPADEMAFAAQSADAIWRAGIDSTDLIPANHALHLAQDRADIDISGPEFNFVRSIRVFDVRFASQRLAGENDECRRFALIYLGAYGTQGEFSWTTSAPTALPIAHVGLEGWGSDCPSIYNRSVFVDWRDYEGNYGFEQVNY